MLDQTLAPPAATAVARKASPEDPSADVSHQDTIVKALGDRPTSPHANESADVTEIPSAFTPINPADVPQTIRGKLSEPADARKEPAAATRIAGYEILSVLGRGGMGIVYKARQIQLDRVVALKMILSGDHAAPEDQARFESEARAVAQFKHPNILQIYEVGASNGQPFFSLEFLEGGTLQEKLEKAPLSVHAAAELVETLARALYYAHQKGVLHRDIKPANVLLAADGTPKIADFGLAKRLDRNESLNANDMVVGTPTYMSPEQALGKSDIGPAADIYSLGASLYEMLVGRPPFRGATVLDTLQQLQQTEPVPLRELQPTVPADLQTICLKCLRKDPKQRYASAQAFADDLRNFLDGRPIEARPVSSVEKAWKWSRRNPAAASLIAVTAVSLLGFAIGGTLFAINEHQRAETQVALSKQIGIERDKADEQRIEAVKQRKLAVDKGKEAEEQRDDAVKQKKLADERGEEAMKNFLQAREAVDVLVRLARDRLANERHLESVGRELMENALKFYDKLQAQQPSDPRMRIQIARAHDLAGNLREKLGRHAEADRGFERAIAMYEALIREDPAQADQYRRDLAGVYINRTTVLQVLQKHEEAEDAFVQAGILLDKVPVSLRDDVDTRILVGKASANRGLYLLRRQDFSGAAAAFEQSIRIFSALKEKIPQRFDLHLELAIAQSNLAGLRTLAAARDFDKAAALYQDAFDVMAPLVEKRPAVPGYRKQLGEIHRGRGSLHAKQGQIDKAMSEFKNARDIFDKLAATYPAVADYRHLTAVACLELGKAHIDKKGADQWKAAAIELRRSSTLLQQMISEEAAQASHYRRDWARSLHSLALAHDLLFRDQFQKPAVKLSDTELQSLAKDVERMWDDALEQWRLLMEPLRGDLSYGQERFDTYQRATVFHNSELTRLAKTPQVEHHLRRRVDLAKELPQLKPESPGLKEVVAGKLLDLAVGQVGLQKHAAAAQTIDELAKTVTPKWSKYPLAARCLTQCIALADKAVAEPERGKTIQAYGDRALTMFADAAGTGWKGGDFLRTDPALEPLRTRPEFRPAFEKLLKDVPGK